MTEKHCVQFVELTEKCTGKYTEIIKKNLKDSNFNNPCTDIRENNCFEKDYKHDREYHTYDSHRYCATKLYTHKNLPYHICSRNNYMTPWNNRFEKPTRKRLFGNKVQRKFLWLNDFKLCE